MKKYGKFRVIIGKYNSEDLPNSTAINGKIYNSLDDARINAIAMIKDLFDSRFATNICPDKGYDPLNYELDTSGPAPIIYYKPPYSIGERIPVFNATCHHILCNFTNISNTIDYRAMIIMKFQDKWYVQSKFGYQIIGIIDNKRSLNEICAEADKIWDNHEDNVEVVSLPNN